MEIYEIQCRQFVEIFLSGLPRLPRPQYSPSDFQIFGAQRWAGVREALAVCL